MRTIWRRNATPRCGAIISTAAALAAIALPSAASADLAAGSFVFDGSISQIAHDPASNKTYVAGDFTQELAPTGAGVVATGDSGSVDPNGFPHLLGSVSAAEQDGSGGWYVAGGFVGQNTLLHLKADGTIDSSFNPDPTYSSPFGSSSGEVDALLLSGTTLYVGGVFDSIGGQIRHSLAAIDTTTGDVTAFNPDVTASGFMGVKALALSGSTLFLGGAFSSVGGQSRTNLAAVDTGTSAVLPWDPDAAQPGVVEGLAVSGASVFAVGSFTQVGGADHDGVAKIDASSGTVSSWAPALDANGSEDAVAVSGSTVFVGGPQNEFTNNFNLYAIDATSGAINSSWPTTDGNVRSLALAGSTLYVGGSFNTVGGTTRHNAAAIDATTGDVTAWNPNPGGEVGHLATGSSKVYVGGSFAGAGQPLATVSRLGRLNADGSVDTSWSPNPVCPNGSPCGSIDALTVRGDRLFVAGGFSTIAGQPRNDLAAFDTSTGSLTPFSPPAWTGRIYAVAPAGDVVYVGGNTLTIGDQTRHGLAAFDANTGELLPWNPDATGGGQSVEALAVVGNKVYAGGFFDSVGGQSRGGLAAIDPVSGAVTPWNPGLVNNAGTAFVSAMGVHGSTLYIAGGFSNVGGANRANLAQLTLDTGTATSWNTDATMSSVEPATDLTVIGSTLYVAGNFRVPHSLTEVGLAALDATTGAADASSWSRQFVGGWPRAIDGATGTLLVGGGFAGVDGVTTGPLAQLSVTGNADVPTDVTAPTISITTPTDGQHIAQGASVTPAYSCDDAGSGVVACTGSGSLDTSTIGTKSYTVTASDAAGNQGRKTVSYTVDAPNSPGEGGGGSSGGDQTGSGGGTPPAVTPTPVPTPPVITPTPPAQPPATPKLIAPSSVRSGQLSRGLSLTLSGGTPGAHYTATLRTGRTVLAVIKGVVGPNGSAKVRIKLSKAALKTAKRQRKLVVGVRLGTKTLSQTLRIK